MQADNDSKPHGTALELRFSAVLSFFLRTRQAQQGVLKRCAECEELLSSLPGGGGELDSNAGRRQQVRVSCSAYAHVCHPLHWPLLLRGFLPHPSFL